MAFATLDDEKNPPPLRSTPFFKVGQVPHFASKRFLHPMGEKRGAMGESVERGPAVGSS